ncbi:MAG: APC family permease, partial [Candidatus Bathyarchaeia archaeon]
VAGSVGLSYSLPIALTITVLLAIVTVSYSQTIYAYPSGGGSYTVARENLGSIPGLVAAAALIIDYLLTAAVSLTAGTEAIASAFPQLWPFRVHLSILILFAITIINLRGLRETGTCMAIPVYLFLFTFLPMLAYGAVQVVIGGGPSPTTSFTPQVIQPLTLSLILHTFSTGCTAMTGIEAISNGVPAFQPPESKNAARTLVIMAMLMGVLFLGSIWLTDALAVVPGPQETVLSALARQLLGSGLCYLAIQFFTMLILVVAANTSFADFPRIASILATDHFLPRQLANLGDRLVYANGIILLSLGTGTLIFVFAGDTHSLIPLFAVGAFLAYTLSQLSMVVHWWREKDGMWMLKAILNGIGASATAVTLLVVGISKFLEGAWVTIILISILVAGFLRIHNHYREVTEQLSLRDLQPPLLKQFPTLRIVIPIAGVNRATIDAISYAKSISNDVRAVYVELSPGEGRRIQEEWQRHLIDVPLVVLPSPYRSIVGPFLEYLDELDQRYNDGQLAAVVIPEWVPARWWHNLLHNQTARLIKNALLYRRRHLGFQRIIIDVPYHLQR